jgi:aspartate aminotransferase-like enzyme
LAFYQQPLCRCRALRDGLEAMGLKLFGDPEHRMARSTIAFPRFKI